MISVIVGDNASGKTNILEAINLLATGKSFKAKVEEEMVGYDADIARISALIEGKPYMVDREENLTAKANRSRIKLEVVLTRGKIKVGENPDKYEKVARKKLSVNGVGKRLIDFAGNFNVVLFSPSDMDIITESPSVRRKFLDTVLSQSDREYRRALHAYEKGLRQRNRLLIRIREEGLSRSQLLFWNSILIKNGDFISNSRQNFIDFINAMKPLNSQTFRVIYDNSAISGERLEQYSKEETAAGTTLVGPHRDDIVIKIKDQKSKINKDRDLSKYGSRGEQRMGVLFLKLSELSFLEKITQDKPVLLLDDIFSELDHEHRDVVMTAVKGRQVIITTADPHFVVGMKRIEKIKI